MPMHDVVIIEDKPEIMARLQAAVAATPSLSVTGTATSLDQGLEMIFKLRPRVVLVDIGLPDGSGIEAISAAALADWPIDSLVISIFADETRVVDAIRAGAKGYILKGGDLENIGSDIQEVIKGGSPISPSIARHLLSIVSREFKDPSGEEAGDFPNPLSEREMEILRSVARGYKRREIATRLGISPGTVGNHINAIYRKLGVASNTQAVARAKRMGLL